VHQNKLVEPLSVPLKAWVTVMAKETTVRAMVRLYLNELGYPGFDDSKKLMPPAHVM
jgi:hypothetical protein